MYCCHRVNTIEALISVPQHYGIEIDLRDDLNGTYLAHDPYTNGILLSDFLTHYNHSFIIFNIKSEGIEKQILSLINKFCIKSYFFLDSSFPMINKYYNEIDFAIRFSEYESIESVLLMKDKVKWVWIDCFTINPLTKRIYDILKQHFKLCFVSPELQNQPLKIQEYKEFFNNNDIHLDMICTKVYNIEKWLDVQIIIPMSGLGQRFIDAGYKDPKPLIIVDNKPIIDHIIDLFPGNKDFSFICNDSHLENTNMYNILEGKGKIYNVPTIGREGPVKAISQIYDHIDDSREVIVSYCDYGTRWDYEKFLNDARTNNVDGAIACYRGFHPHMLGKDNYAFLKETEDGSMYMEQIREKQPFTNNRMNEYASNGTYYFKNGKIMKKYFRMLMDKKVKVNNEYYVSMVYNLLKDDNLKIRIFEIENMLQWGTPHDLEDYMFWSNYFNDKRTPLISFPDINDTTLILPMAGYGSRFKDKYIDPKPLIKVDDKSMIEQAVNCLPVTSNKVFICLQDHVTEYNIDQVLKDKYENCKVKIIDHVTDGQATTCHIGMQDIDLEKPILISACDNGVLYDVSKYNDMVNNISNDVIVWTYRDQGASRNNANAYAWLETDVNDNVLNVSCKKFNVEKHDIKKSHVIIGTMFFRKAKYFFDGYEKNRINNIRTNNEFYVDDIINRNIEIGLTVKVFQVKYYICWGTPNDYETYNYWQKYFNSMKLS
jgi:NDP-sugar pyrophosphorylase family protein